MEGTDNVSDFYSTVAESQTSSQTSNFYIPPGRNPKSAPVSRLCIYFTLWQVALMCVCIVGLFFGVYRVYGTEERVLVCPTLAVVNQKGALLGNCTAPTVAPEHATLAAATQRVFAAGEEIEYRCNDSYRRSGDGKLVCVRGNRWLQAGFCALKANNSRACEKPTVPDHAILSADQMGGYAIGDEVNYQCEDGYRLTGSGKLVCARNGQWRQAGQCRLISNSLEGCRAPTVAPEGATVHVALETNYSLGDEITYGCENGYRLTGAGKLVCARDGQWRQAGQCRLISNILEGCQTPADAPDAGILVDATKTSYLLGDEIVYQCEDGYRLTGAGRLICVRNGQWRQAGQCSLKTNRSDVCQTPVASENAVLLGNPQTNYSIGDQIRYRCDSGYQLVGGGRMVCGRGSEWHQVGFCRANACPRPENTTALYNPRRDAYAPDETVIFRCRPREVLRGNASVSCLPSGKWSNSIPTCEDVTTCPTPRLGDRMRIRPRRCSYDVGDFVTYSCESGYTVQGQNLSLCTPTGEWFPSTPKCIKARERVVHCRPPSGTPRKGSFDPVKERYNVSDTVSYSCDAGYGIDGYYYLTCLPNGTWSYPPPNCTVLETPQCVNGSWTFYFVPYIHTSVGTFANLNEFCRSYPDMCPDQLPTAVDLVYLENSLPRHYRLAKQIVHVDPQNGLGCLNSEQIDGRPCSHLYAVRFCLPIPTGSPRCSQRWTRFLNQDHPSASGDYEKMIDHSTGQTICQNYPTSIDVRLVATNADYRSVNRKYLLIGAVSACVHRYEDLFCHDYKVRYCCQEVTCPSGTWTPFFNLDSPDGEGDYETVIEARRLHPSEMCSGNVTAIDARNVLDGGLGYSQYSRAVHNDPKVGFWCLNSEQPAGQKCRDYQVRFCCA